MQNDSCGFDDCNIPVQVEDFITKVSNTGTLCVHLEIYGNQETKKKHKRSEINKW